MAESIIIDRELKPVVLKQIDPNQFGFIPGSSTTFALISIFHHWLSTCDSRHVVKEGTPECRNTGMPEHWNAGTPEYIFAVRENLKKKLKRNNIVQILLIIKYT